MGLSPRAGTPAEPSMLVNIPRLVTTYYARQPDPTVPSQRVAFGTSGHRGSAFDRAFNEAHILAISQAICLYRRQQRIDGPLFLGIDTHALSEAASASALEVLAANGVDVMIDDQDGYTPTPVISHAILAYNRGRTGGLADGIVITPSHNPPEDGGFKYNPPHGGPADSRRHRAGSRTSANVLARRGPRGREAGSVRAGAPRPDHAPPRLHGGLRRRSRARGRPRRRCGTRSSNSESIPWVGAGVRYWGLIAERYGIPLTVVSDVVDPTFRFMTLDWDGKIRMDCSSPYAMQRLIALKDRFDVAWACDTDHDRHGIVAGSAGLLNPNHYLAVAISYLFDHRPGWRKDAGIGKTLVSSSLIDRVAARLGRTLLEVPVGFKWFVDGLLTVRSASAARRARGPRSSVATARCGPPTRTGSSWAFSPQR